MLTVVIHAGMVDEIFSSDPKDSGRPFRTADLDSNHHDTIPIIYHGFGYSASIEYRKIKFASKPFISDQPI